MELTHHALTVVATAAETGEKGFSFLTGEKTYPRSRSLQELEYPSPNIKGVLNKSRSNPPPSLPCIESFCIVVPPSAIFHRQKLWFFNYNTTKSCFFNYNTTKASILQVPDRCPRQNRSDGISVRTNDGGATVGKRESAEREREELRVSF